jgi:hypothetical protein
MALPASLRVYPGGKYVLTSLRITRDAATLAFCLAVFAYGVKP